MQFRQRQPTADHRQQSKAPAGRQQANAAWPLALFRHLVLVWLSQSRIQLLMICVCCIGGCQRESRVVAGVGARDSAAGDTNELAEESACVLADVGPQILASNFSQISATYLSKQTG